MSMGVQSTAASVAGGGGEEGGGGESCRGSRGTAKGGSGALRGSTFTFTSSPGDCSMTARGARELQGMTAADDVGMSSLRNATTTVAAEGHERCDVGRGEGDRRWRGDEAEKDLCIIFSSTKRIILPAVPSPPLSLCAPLSASSASAPLPCPSPLPFPSTLSSLPSALLLAPLPRLPRRVVAVHSSAVLLSLFLRVLSSSSSSSSVSVCCW